MGFFDSVKSSAIKAKLKGEIALLDREISSQQSAFGVELYDKLQQQSAGKNFANLGEIMPSALKGANEKAVKEPLEACRADVQTKQNEVDAKLLEIEKLQCDRERSRISSTMERFKSDTASRSTEAKLQVQIKLLRREIQQRKEQFGRDVFDVMVDANDSERGGERGLLGKIKQDKNQKEMAAIIERAARPIAVARQKRSVAQRDMEELDVGSAP